MHCLFISHMHGLVYVITYDYEYLDAKTLFSLSVYPEKPISLTQLPWQDQELF